MSAEGIHFFEAEIEFEPAHMDDLKDWIAEVAAAHGFVITELNYVFCSDEYLLQLNKEHLNHDFYTDILTFPYEDPDSGIIAGDIFISIDRVKENATELGNTFEDELHRVMVHGVLHMTGQGDHDEAEPVMRKKEDEALLLRSF